MIQDEANVAEMSSADEMRADVTAAISSLKDTNSAAPIAADSADAPSAPPSPSSLGRPRDEHGRFAAKVEGDDAPPAAPAVSDADPAQANIDPPSTAAVEAPKSWSADAKAAFATLAPAVQQAVIKRESEINDGGARWSEEKRTYETALAPVRDISTRHNVPPAETIKRLAAANEYLERDPAAAIRWLATSYKVDLSALATQPSPPQADPMVAELTSKISQLEQFVQNQQLSGVDRVISEFAAKQTHWDDQVMAEVSDMIPVAKSRNPGADHATLLQTAYDMAVWANPGLRTKLIEAQTADQLKQRQQVETTAKARRGALSVNGAPAGGIAPPPRSDPNASVADDVRAALAQLRH